MDSSSKARRAASCPDLASLQGRHWKCYGRRLTMLAGTHAWIRFRENGIRHPLPAYDVVPRMDDQAAVVARLSPVDHSEIVALDTVHKCSLFGQFDDRAPEPQ